MIYFVSDMHLGAAYVNDVHRHERRIVEWLDSISDKATELYIMGDALDFWFEYRSVIPRGFTRFFGALARLSDSGVKIYWMRGNHDMWIFDYLPTEIGCEILDGPIIRKIGDKTFFLDHGDGVGKRSLGFRVIRKVFRNSFCRRLFASVHPKWALGVAHAWSAGSRKSGMKHEYSRAISNPADEPLVRFAQTFVENSQELHIDYFVFGHRHAPLDLALSNGSSRVIILGDWLTGGSYAQFDGNTLKLMDI